MEGYFKFSCLFSWFIYLLFLSLGAQIAETLNAIMKMQCFEHMEYCALSCKQLFCELKIWGLAEVNSDIWFLTISSLLLLLLFSVDTEDEPVYQPQSLCLSEMDLPVRDDLETDVESESNCTGKIHLKLN